MKADANQMVLCNKMLIAIGVSYQLGFITLVGYM